MFRFFTFRQFEPFFKELASELNFKANQFILKFISCGTLYL